MLDDESFVDIVLVVGSGYQPIHAHRVLLSAFSPFFRDRLRQMPLPSSSSGTPAQLHLPDLTHRAVRALLENLYGHKDVRDALKLANAADRTTFRSEVLAAADYLQLSDMANKCKPAVEEVRELGAPYAPALGGVDERTGTLQIDGDVEQRTVIVDVAKLPEWARRVGTAASPAASPVSSGKQREAGLSHDAIHGDGRQSQLSLAPTAPMSSSSLLELAAEACSCARTINPQCPEDGLLHPIDGEDARQRAQVPFEERGQFAFGHCAPCIARHAISTKKHYEGAVDSCHFIIISRNYESYLCGHSIYAWHLSHYLLAETEAHVYHITHSDKDGPLHGKQICPPIVHQRYHRRIVGVTNHAKLPSAFKSCFVADELADCITTIQKGSKDPALEGGASEEKELPVVVICINPFLFAADVLAVARQAKVPCFASMRGTDFLLLKKAHFGDTPAGRRYLQALREMDGIYVMSEWMLREAQKLGAPAKGIMMTITGLPASTDLNHHWIRWCDSVGFDPNDARPLVCYGARLIARTLRNVLASDGVRVLIAGSGPSEAEVRETVPQIEGRSVITKLSIFEVYAVASHCGKLKQSLLITAPGFEGDFQEALGSTYVFFSSAGTPVLFPIDQNTGGAVEAVSPQNTAWCLGIRDVETWPAEISKLLEGDYDHLDLQGSNRRYGRRFRQQLQLSAHLAEWATAAVDMAACASKRSTEKAN